MYECMIEGTLYADTLVPGQKSLLTHSLDYLVNVAKVNAVARAGINTGWVKTRINPFNAQVTLLGYFFLFFKLHHAKGTSIDAIFATDAKLLINQNNAVLSFGYCVYWAGIITRRLATMHAVGNSISKLPFTLHDARSISVDSYPSWANGQVMLLFTGDLTSTTADTIRDIHDKGKFFYH